MVVEADESDGSFLRLDGTIAVVTNIDPEHLEHYGSFDAAKDAYVEFVENVPFYGLAVMCVDHPEVQNILSRIRDRRVMTYGSSALADLRAVNIEPRGRRQPVRRVGASAPTASGALIEGMFVPMPGRHNVLNALAAIAVGIEFGMDDATLVNGFKRFTGVKRRFTPRRRDRRRADHRRLCPPPGRNPRGAVGGARKRARSASSRSSSRTASPGCAT